MNKELRGTTKVELHQANVRLLDDVKREATRASVLDGRIVLARREIDEAIAELAPVQMPASTMARLSRAYRILSGA